MSLVPTTTRARCRRLTWRLAAVACLAGTAAGGARERSVEVPGSPAELAAYLDGWRAGRAAGVRVTDPLLAARIERLRAESRTFDAAWRRLQRQEVPTVIGTREQLEAQLPRGIRGSDAWAGITVAWSGDREALVRTAVAIRVRWLRDLHARYGNTEAHFLEALDGLIIHEVYGHLTPAIDARGPASLCADPEPHQRHADSCVGRREREILRELGE